MIVAICGAYRNAGDHLIGDRGRALLRSYVDPEIITIDRRSIEPGHYDVFNRARAVVLCGGPAYQRAIYPGIYPIERERVTPAIVPYGLGWKGPAKGSPDTFRFKPDAVDFIRAIHGRIEVSSARDPLTVEVLARQGVSNVLMTGCPAWYDLSTFENPYAFKDEVRTLVLSMPPALQPGTFDLMVWLGRRFPKARRVLSFHHGLLPSNTPKGREVARQFVRFSASAMMRGWRVAGLAGSLSKLETLYGSADLHVGYRVHAHLFCLSRRISSILICEDSRGVGQAKAFGSPVLTVDDGNLDKIKAAVESHFATRGEAVVRSISIMRDTFPTMRRFLASI